MKYPQTPCGDLLDAFAQCHKDTRDGLHLKDGYATVADLRRELLERMHTAMMVAVVERRPAVDVDTPPVTPPGLVH